MRAKPDEPRQERPLRAGVVTRLAGQQHDPERVSVFIDGAFAFGVHADLLVEFGLHRGQALTVAQQQQIIDADRTRAANVTALAYLGYRARTQQEVRQKLARSGFDEAVAERTIARLTEMGYLDDAAYARAYVTARFQNKGYGPRRLQDDLRRRGVAPAIVEEALDALGEQEDLLEAARRHAAKRWPRLASEANPYKRRQKLSAFLVRRGFTYDTARRVIEELENQAGEGEG